MQQKELIVIGCTIKNIARYVDQSNCPFEFYG